MIAVSYYYLAVPAYVFASSAYLIGYQNASRAVIAEGMYRISQAIVSAHLVIHAPIVSIPAKCSFEFAKRNACKLGEMFGNDSEAALGEQPKVA